MFKTRFVKFPHRGETKKHPWDRILQFRFHATILGGLFQAAQNAGVTKVVEFRSKRVFSIFPIGTKRKNSLGSNLPILVLYHHFGWAIPSSAISRVDEGRPNAFKTRFFDFPHRSETQKHPWNRFYQFRFHTTISGGLLQAVQKAALTKVIQLRSKRVFSSFPIGAKRKNTLGIEFHELGFIPPFWVGFYKQCKKPGWRRWFIRLFPTERNVKTPLGSNSTKSVSYHHFGRAFQRSGKRRFNEGRPIAVKTRVFEFPYQGERKKYPWDRIPRGRFHTTIYGGLLQAA